MYNQIERELKCLLDEKQYNSIMNSYEFPTTIYQANAYYDTEDAYMKSIQGALRIRTINNRYIFTLKIRTDEITLIELEKDVKDDQIQHAFEDEEIKGWLAKYSIPTQVKKITEFSTVRKLLQLENAELCLDHTTYEWGNDYEIEYEYTREHDGIACFQSLLEPFGISYKKNCSSKLARALKFVR